MPLISETYHEKKLNDYGINIKTKYIAGNKILERNTENSVNDDIISGIRCKKEYYRNNKLLHTEGLFDSRIEYTFVSKDEENKEYTCPNCGMHSKLKDFKDGCPYCKTNYNIDYTNKDLGSKYHYDLVLRSNKYRIITFIIDLFISTLLSFFFIKYTSRTFNVYDISKVFIYGFILSLCLYYFFYLLDAYVVILPIKKYKNNQNKKQQEFWNKTKIDKKSFFNNLNYEIGKYYYNRNFIIDYDLLDYTSFKLIEKDNNTYVEVTAEIRLVFYKNNKIKSKITKEKYLLKRNTNVLDLKGGANMIRCHNCGASIDVIKGKCDYCNANIKYFQEWILIFEDI